MKVCRGYMMTRTHAQWQGWLEVCNKHHSQDCTEGGSEQGSVHPQMQKRPVGNVRIRTTVPNNALFQRYRPCRDACERVCEPKSVCECAWVHARRCTCASEREQARGCVCVIERETGRERGVRMSVAQKSFTRTV